MIDWLIIGGGIHGVTLALSLIERHGLVAEQVRLLDPHEHLLARWSHVTRSTGMAYLRSPGVHHLHYDPFALRTFALARGYAADHFVPIFQRPSLALFNAYSQHLIDRSGLTARHVRAVATGLSRLAAGWRVETSLGSLEAQRVVLALGTGDTPHWPDWARSLHTNGAPIHHVFEQGFQRDTLPASAAVVVVGGGITAAQTAMTLSQTHGAVTLLHRHALRQSHFDSDPCWVTRLCLESFYREADFTRRRTLIRTARQRGSLPPDVAEALQAAAYSGRVRLRLGTVTEAAIEPSGQIRLRLSDEDLTADQVILATGYEQARPGGDWLTAAIHAYGLPTAPDGYPIVKASLCWADGLYVMGPLAELEIGPTSRNIIGARLAAERIGSA